jgi:hypothetical protein
MKKLVVIIIGIVFVNAVFDGSAVFSQKTIKTTYNITFAGNGLSLKINF